MKTLNYENLIKTVYDLQIVNALAKKETVRLVEMSEDIYHNQVKKASDQIVLGGYKIVLVTGPSSAGKTTSSRLLKSNLAKEGFNCHIISTDDFFINREDTPTLPNGLKDYENVTTVDIKCFRNFLTDLVNKGEASLPKYDFITGTRSGYSTMKLKEKDIILIEGLHAHNPLLIDVLPNDRMYKVYISLNSDFIIGENIVIQCKKLRLMRRMIRDYYVRAQSITTTLDQWKEVVRGERRFVRPYKKDANFIIDTTHLYEPLIYDKYLQPLLKSLSSNKTVAELLQIFEHTGSLNKEIIPENSLLKEFIRIE